jgi:hypothetical protein
VSLVRSKISASSFAAALVVVDDAADSAGARDLRRTLPATDQRKLDEYQTINGNVPRGRDSESDNSTTAYPQPGVNLLPAC